VKWLLARCLRGFDACFKAHAACVEKGLSEHGRAVNRGQGHLSRAGLIKVLPLFSWLLLCAVLLYFRRISNVVALYDALDGDPIGNGQKQSLLLQLNKRGFSLRAPWSALNLECSSDSLAENPVKQSTSRYDALPRVF
jgi:hypothetical protein